MDFEKVLKFWFEELKPKDWFRKDAELDAKIRSQFQGPLQQALKGELHHWRLNEWGRLAEIIVLDQFSRNIHRDSGLAFAGDPIALTLAQEMVSWNLDQKIEIPKRAFVYMPYMHSESLLIHQEATKLFAQPGLEDNYKFEIRHKNIIERFGRFPHRNQCLGRPSTAQEIEFLKQPGSSF